MLSKFIQLITGVDCTESVTYKTQSLHLKCFLEDNIKHLPASSTMFTVLSRYTTVRLAPCPTSAGAHWKRTRGDVMIAVTVVAYQKVTVPATS